MPYKFPAPKGRSQSRLCRWWSGESPISIFLLPLPLTSVPGLSSLAGPRPQRALYPPEGSRPLQTWVPCPEMALGASETVGNSAERSGTLRICLLPGSRSIPRTPLRPEFPFHRTNNYRFSRDLEPRVASAPSASGLAHSSLKGSGIAGGLAAMLPEAVYRHLVLTTVRQTLC